MIRTGVLRHQLFKPSEPFIYDQAAAVRSTPISFLGRVVTGTKTGDPDFRLFAESVPAALRYLLLGDTSQLQRACREIEVGLLHAHFGTEGIYAGLAARELDLPYVTTLHGYDVTYATGSLIRSGSPAWLRFGLQRRGFLRSAEFLVCVSEFVKERAVRLGADPHNCYVIPNGVDTARIEFSPPPQNLTIVHVGRLVEVKGTEYLLRAVAVVAAVLGDVKLRVVGDGPLRTRLESLAESLGIGRNVEFLGVLRHEETLRQIRDARVLCLPSVRVPTGATEALGQVLLEACALGRPVVATSSGGIPEAVHDGSNGYLVGERDVPALADALLSVLTSDQDAARMGVRGRRLVEERFELEKCVAALEEIYAKAA